MRAARRRSPDRRPQRHSGEAVGTLEHAQGLCSAETVPHPTDAIIERLAGDPSDEGTPAERGLIVERLATVPFSEHVKEAANAGGIGASIVGEPHPATGVSLKPGDRIDSWSAHLAKRIKQRKWAKGTSREQYLSDLRAAIRHGAAGLVVGVDDLAGQAVAGVLTPLEASGLPCLHVVPRMGQWVWVIYDPRRGALKSGYTVDRARASQLETEWRNGRTLPRPYGEE